MTRAKLYQIKKNSEIEQIAVTFWVLFHGVDMVVEIWYDRKWVSIPWKWLECFYWILNWEQEHFDICNGGKSLYELKWGETLTWGGICSNLTVLLIACGRIVRNWLRNSNLYFDQYFKNAKRFIQSGLIVSNIVWIHWNPM